MDRSVYTPGAGHLPPVLAGRDSILHEWQLTLNDVAAVGRTRARDLILTGPRGVGKTATLTTFGLLATQAGFETVTLQAVAGHAGVVASLLQRAAVRVEQGSGAWARAKRAFDRIESINLGAAGISAGVSRRTGGSSGPAPVLEPSTLAEALVTLVRELRAERPHGGLLVTVDEMQVASPADLALLAATLHRLNVDHPSSVVVFAGTGLPHTPEALRSAGVTHPDRLFLLEPLPVALDRADAIFAVIEPARRCGVLWHPDAAEAVAQVSNGYPAHLQSFAHAVWTAAPGPDLVTVADANAAIPAAAAEIERRTLGPRWDRMSDRQMEYLAALAVNGGSASSGQLAATLGRTNQELSWLRQELIREGDIHVPHRGQVALAVPLFVPYILARYDADRVDAEVSVLTLAQMRRNGGLPARRRPAGTPRLPG